MNIKATIVLLLLAIGSVAIGQTDDESQKMATTERSFQEQYQRNIKKTRINGVYIPADLQEAFDELSALAEEAGVDKFKSAPEEVIARRLHFGLGRWIAVNWNLEEGSRYEYYLKQLGLVKVDDMIQYTIVSWHRHLLGKEQQSAERIKAYQEQVEAELAARRERTQVVKEETRKLPKE